MPPSIGLSIREHNRDILPSTAVSAVEFTFERASNALLTYRNDSMLRAKPYRSVHALKASPGSVAPPAEAYLDAIADFARAVNATAISDHIGITHHGGRDLGHFAPVVYRRGAVNAIARNCDIIRRRLERGGVNAPIFLENIAYFAEMWPEHATMTEPEFVCEVLRASGCGLLLDLENVHANAVNFAYDPFSFIDQVAAVGAKCQIHLAGGHTEAGFYLDSHAHPVPASTWALFRYALSAIPTVEAVFIERDAPPSGKGDSLELDLQQARAIAAEVFQ
jgi:uncharacterized protein (UPF0276 family)